MRTIPPQHVALSSLSKTVNAVSVVACNASSRSRPAASARSTRHELFIHRQQALARPLALVLVAGLGRRGLAVLIRRSAAAAIVAHGLASEDCESGERRPAPGEM